MKFALSVLLIACLALNAQTLQGKVVRVADGDTITILDSTNAPNKVRLNKIDALEKKQAFGEASRKYLANMVANKEVKVGWTRKDLYEWTRGDVRFVSHDPASI